MTFRIRALGLCGLGHIIGLISKFYHGISLVRSVPNDPGLCLVFYCVQQCLMWVSWDGNTVTRCVKASNMNFISVLLREWLTRGKRVKKSCVLCVFMIKTLWGVLLYCLHSTKIGHCRETIPTRLLWLMFSTALMTKNTLIILRLNLQTDWTWYWDCSGVMAWTIRVWWSQF